MFKGRSHLSIDITTKLRKITKVSKRVRLEMVRDALRMDAPEFNQKIFDWAEEFGFTIDGDYVDFAGSDVDAFVKSLDAQFASWGTSEHSKSGKQEKASLPLAPVTPASEVPPKNLVTKMFVENVHRQVLQVNSNLVLIQQDVNRFAIEVRRGLHDLKYEVPLKQYGGGEFYKILKWGKYPYIRISDFKRMPQPPEDFKLGRSFFYESPDPNSHPVQIPVARIGSRAIMALHGKKHYFLERDINIGRQFTPESAEQLKKCITVWDGRASQIQSAIRRENERIGNYQNEDRSLYMQNSSIDAQLVENSVQQLDALITNSQELMTQVEAMSRKFHSNKNTSLPGVKKTRRGKRG